MIISSRAGFVNAPRAISFANIQAVLHDAALDDIIKHELNKRSVIAIHA